MDAVHCCRCNNILSSNMPSEYNQWVCDVKRARCQPSDVKKGGSKWMQAEGMWRSKHLVAIQWKFSENAGSNCLDDFRCLFKRHILHIIYFVWNYSGKLCVSVDVPIGKCVDGSIEFRATKRASTNLHRHFSHTATMTRERVRARDRERERSTLLILLKYD